jgi:hypothetical protein
LSQNVFFFAFGVFSLEGHVAGRKARVLSLSLTHNQLLLDAMLATRLRQVSGLCIGCAQCDLSYELHSFWRDATGPPPIWRVVTSWPPEAV